MFEGNDLKNEFLEKSEKKGKKVSTIKS